MGGFRFSFPACVIAGKGRIDSDDIVMLRSYAFPAGLRSADDALCLLALDECCIQKTPDWATYCIENLSAFLVHGSEPAGRIDEAKAAWLIRTIADEGVVYSPLGLDFLLHAMEIASEVPESLSAFALDQLRLAICVSPRGAYHLRRSGADGVTVEDLAFVWRILRGALERGRLMLSPLETLVLRSIDDCVDTSNHHPAWREMMAAIVTLDRPKETLRASPWIRTEERHLLDELAA